MRENRVAITGHVNIEKCFNAEMIGIGAEYEPVSFKTAMDLAKTFITALQNSSDNKLVMNIGMARGWDEICALAALELNVPIDLYVPASVRWHQFRAPSRNMFAQATQYQKILDSPLTRNVFEVPKAYRDGFQFANFARNAAMIDNSTETASFKFYNSSGTNHAISCAEYQGKYIGNAPDLEMSAISLGDGADELTSIDGCRKFLATPSVKAKTLKKPKRL